MSKLANLENKLGSRASSSGSRVSKQESLVMLQNAATPDEQDLSVSKRAKREKLGKLLVAKLERMNNWETKENTPDSRESHHNSET